MKICPPAAWKQRHVLNVFKPCLQIEERHPWFGQPTCLCQNYSKTCLRYIFSLYVALLALYCVVHLIQSLHTIDMQCNYALINVIIHISTPYLSISRFLHHSYLPHSLPCLRCHLTIVQLVLPLLVVCLQSSPQQSLKWYIIGSYHHYHHQGVYRE